MARHQKAIDFITRAATQDRAALIARLKAVHDIHAEYAACHIGGARRVGNNMATVAKRAYEWLGDERQHPKGFAVWAAEETARLVIVIGAAAKVCDMTLSEQQGLFDD